MRSGGRDERFLARPGSDAAGETGAESAGAAAGGPQPGVPVERASHRRSLLEAALQALPIGVSVYDGEGHCILANAMALGLGPACPMEIPIVQLAAPEDGERGPFVSDDGGRVIEARVRALGFDQETYNLATFIDVTHHHRTREDLVRRAYVDLLTGLPNRMLIEQYVEDLIAGIEPGRRSPWPSSISTTSSTSTTTTATPPATPC